MRNVVLALAAVGMFAATVPASAQYYQEGQRFDGGPTYRDRDDDAVYPHHHHYDWPRYRHGFGYGRGYGYGGLNAGFTVPNINMSLNAEVGGGMTSQFGLHDPKTFAEDPKTLPFFTAGLRAAWMF